MGLFKTCALTTATLLAISVLSLSVCWIGLGHEHIPNRVVRAETIRNASYDFIIVGAGTAGSVLANRLSANANVSVLLIEAGDVFGAASVVPLLATTLQQTSSDWAFRTTPQKYSSRGLINNQQFLPRGRGLGGSGQINYMLHFTGTGEDFERWERLGAIGWGYEAMKPYRDGIERERNEGEACPTELRDDEIFEQNQYPSMLPTGSKSQLFNFCPSSVSSSSQEHSPKLFVTTTENVLSKAFTDAGAELGLANHNFNPARYTIRNGIRWSSYHEYLRPAFGRANLHVLTNSVAQRVIFDEAKRAVGVAVADSVDGTAIVINALREVILSSGAFQTPQLLKLSGVGPAAELKRHNVPLVHDAPQVGQNLFDHLNLPLYVSINASASVTLNKIANLHSIWNYLKHGTGVFSSTAVAGIGSPRNANFGIILFGMGTVDEQALRHVSNMKQDSFQNFFPLHRNTTQEGFLFLSTCHQPKSRGAIYLRDRNAHSKPFINPNYLKHPADIDCMTEAIRLAAKTAATEPFRRMNATIHWPRVRSCTNFGPFEEDFRTNRPSDRYLECILRVSALTGHHPGGTAAMGRGGVVDGQLRVNGVRGLRVVDASVFPAPISGTPNSVIIAVAERASDIIVRDNSNG
ncbi:neither inactivation nor afterpotential protein G [Culex quinquefasciatus]|uniref:neither inactivation nor afterpotential protein G n=1 Tax=Culex quinquefasciatus TaxID=7176 RepID=UPI0018E3F9DC|nr:neither inactivation nor afterpotential protein G [Culex quinquefasciatus]